jgi:hypothetical protein
LEKNLKGFTNKCSGNNLMKFSGRKIKRISHYLILRKSRFRILFWFIFFAAVVLILFIVLGYFVASKQVSYLPNVYLFDSVINTSRINKFELKNQWYILIVDEYGKVVVKTIDGEIIMSGLTYYSDYEGARNNWGLENISVRQDNDSTISITGYGPLGVLVNESLIIHNDIPKIDFKIGTRYNSDIIVFREALVAKFDVPLSEVYLKNRKIDFGPFDSEYWLQRQGVRFGSGSKSSLIYNTQHVSSLQLNSEKNLLFVNLDYFLDHPFINIPFQKDSTGKWVDLSKANYTSGTERNDYFSIYFGPLPEVIPRLMLMPYGYLAGYVFTEHADGGNIRTNRAAYFGADNITDIANAIGGFCRYRIPVTKSVFYSDSTGISASIRDDPDKPQFLNFLDQLYTTGLYDICLHTPENYSSNRVTLEESIQFMKKRFDASTWIDHGMYKGTLNRECIVCDGLNPISEYYAADFWEKYQTRYFWSPAIEMIEGSQIPPLKKSLKELRVFRAYVDLWRRYFSSNELKELRFSTAVQELITRYLNQGELNSFMQHKGNAYPTPLFWQHPTRTRQFYSWATDFAKDYRRLSAKTGENQVISEEKQLDELLIDWGIFINHGYFVRNRKGYDILNEHEGRIVINPFFDKILEFMAKKRDEGDLYITTIKNLLDYMILCENISFEYMPDGSINVYNDNKITINGLSLVLRANKVKVNNQTPFFRQVGSENIFWFDIPAKSHVNLIVEQ